MAVGQPVFDDQGRGHGVQAGGAQTGVKVGDDQHTVLEHQPCMTAVEAGHHVGFEVCSVKVNAGGEIRRRQRVDVQRRIAGHKAFTGLIEAVVPPLEDDVPPIVGARHQIDGRPIARSEVHVDVVEVGVDVAHQDAPLAQNRQAVGFESTRACGFQRWTRKVHRVKGHVRKPGGARARNVHCRVVQHEVG